jgi:hypothetical protein
METIGKQDWPPVELAWRQKLAAYWSIAWPGQLATLLLTGAIASRWSADEIMTHAVFIGVVGNVTLLFVQALLVPRLVRKQYRSFYVVMLRDHGSVSRKLPQAEAVRVSIRVLVPQVLFLAAFSIFVFFLQDANLDDQMLRGISSLSIWLRFLLVGPYSMQFAVPGAYRGFRLQSYGQRFV